MFYVIDEKGSHEIEARNISPKDITVGFMSLKEYQNCYESLGAGERTLDACLHCSSHLRFFQSAFRADKNSHRLSSLNR